MAAYVSLAMFPFLLFLLVAVSTATLCLWSIGARDDITRQDPEFAALLFRSGSELAFARGLPLRGHVLLFVKPSSVHQSTLRPLKIMYCINALFVLLFLGSLIVDT